MACNIARYCRYISCRIDEDYTRLLLHNCRRLGFPAPFPLLDTDTVVSFVDRVRAVAVNRHLGQLTVTNITGRYHTVQLSPHRLPRVHL